MDSISSHFSNFIFIIRRLVMAIDIFIRVEENYELVIFVSHMHNKNIMSFLYSILKKTLNKTFVFISKKAGRMFVWGCISGFAQIEAGPERFAYRSDGTKG